MLLTVKGQSTNAQTLEFSLHPDDNDVNVHANGGLIGWFEVNDGKVRYVSTYPGTDEKELFELDEFGYVAVAE